MKQQAAAAQLSTPQPPPLYGDAPAAAHDRETLQVVQGTLEKVLAKLQDGGVAEGLAQAQQLASQAQTVRSPCPARSALLVSAR